MTIRVAKITVDVVVGGPYFDARTILEFQPKLRGTISGTCYNVIELSYDIDEYPEYWEEDCETLENLL